MMIDYLQTAGQVGETTYISRDNDIFFKTIFQEKERHGDDAVSQQSLRGFLTSKKYGVPSESRPDATATGAACRPKRLPYLFSKL